MKKEVLLHIDLKLSKAPYCGKPVKKPLAHRQTGTVSKCNIRLLFQQLAHCVMISCSRLSAAVLAGGSRLVSMCGKEMEGEGRQKVSSERLQSVEDQGR